MREGSIRRVAVVFPGALGDLLLATPALRALRRRHDGARTTIVVAGPLRALARTLALADDVADLDDAEAARLFAGDVPPAWLTERPTLYAWLGAGDADVGARLTSWTVAATFFRVERGPDGPHAMLAYARMIGDDWSPAELAADGRLAPASSTRVDELCGRAPRPLLALHRGAGAIAKRWTADGFAAVARAWHDRGGTVVDLAGPADDDLAPLVDAVAVRGWPLPDVAALLARVDAYAGNDSGISHLAGAVGARGAVVFAATAAARWRPLTGRLVAIETSPGRDVVDAVLRAVILDNIGP
jgi:heptosyltransferase-2/heptosyltransferase-3